ncbi:MAG TPA: hypothetical protein DD435_03915, partial [Cyanobacteria bacterium UBA8530]|nr:hypothetical protein [Cyanobacteria bacterium UBA8530]
RTVFVVLTKPVGRHQFLLGKFFGLASTLFVLWAAMAATYLALVFFLAHSLSGQTFLALFFILVELVLLTALSLFFSTFASPVMSMVYVFSLFFVGHNSATWKFLAQKASPLVRFFTDVAYYVLPNLKDLDFKEAAVYALSVDPVRVLQSLSYGIAYTSFLLAAAVIVFSLREF